MNVIRFEEALLEAQSGLPVVLRFVTYDSKRKTKNGQIREMQLVATKPISEKNNDSIQVLPNAEVKEKKTHADHFTRCFYQCIDGHPTATIKKIHMELILAINGKTVML